MSLAITADTAANAQANISAYNKKAARGLANASRFLADEPKNPDAARRLIDASLAVEQTWFKTWLTTKFLAREGYFKAALPLAW